MLFYGGDKCYCQNYPLQYVQTFSTLPLQTKVATTSPRISKSNITPSIHTIDVFFL